MKRTTFFSLVFLVCSLGLFTRSTTRAAEMVEGDHKIAPLDVLNIDVVGEKELSKELRVSSNGTVTFPFLGSIEVKGKTPAEVEDLLREKLGKDYLVDPQVIVTVKEYRARVVTVLGQVNKGGLISLPAEQKMDILEAIAQAGDLTRGAKKNRIEVTRKGQVFKFSLDDLKKESDPKKKFWLEPGDGIYVYEAFF